MGCVAVDQSVGRRDPDGATAEQLILFDGHRLPHRPYCSEDKTARSIRTKAHAVRFPYISVNPPHLRMWMVFDIDREGGAMAWEGPGLPPPAWAAADRVSTKAHIAYGLDAPVLTGDAARTEPLRYLAAIESAYAAAMDADLGFAGLMTKNPVHPLWRTYVGPQRLWSLSELAEYVDLRKHAPKRRPEAYGLGRNVTLFDHLRLWAYTAVRRHRGERNVALWQAEVFDRALTLNGDFPHPMAEREVGHIAKSVGKWVWKRDTQARADFLARQSAKGAKGGKASGVIRLARAVEGADKALALRQQGLSLRAISEALGVTDRTVRNWLRAGGNEA